MFKRVSIISVGLFLCAIEIFSVLTPPVYALLPDGGGSSSPAPAAPVYTEQNDLDRRKLYTMRECLLDYLDTDDEVTSVGDAFKDYTYDNRVVPVGPDRAPHSGAMSCKDVMDQIP